MVLIAVDPHKASYTARAVDGRGGVLGGTRVTAKEREALLRWAEQWPQRRWAIEGARGLGQPLAQWLVGRGEAVMDVPARLVRRVRELGGSDKSDAKDARAIAEAALRAEELQRVEAEDESTVLRLLTDRRDDLAGERTRTANRLHRLLRELAPGGAPRRLSARRAAALLCEVQARSAADRERLRQAEELLAELRRLDGQLRESLQRITVAVRARGTRLQGIPGVGPVVAAKLLGRTGRVERFASEAHFASYSGTAPLEASSGEVVRHRLSRRGDRQLNAALHIVAVTQLRMRASRGYVYYWRRRAEGKSAREALRCLKRQLARVVYRCLQADAAMR
jgi:transposase